MINHAIDLGTGLAVIPVFRMEEVTRLTPNGFQNVLRTEALIYDAKGLTLLGRGDSIKAPEDADDDVKGLKKALGRALMDAMLYPEERDIVFKTLMQELRLQIEQQVVVTTTPAPVDESNVVDGELVPFEEEDEYDWNPWAV